MDSFLEIDKTEPSHTNIDNNRSNCNAGFLRRFPAFIIDSIFIQISAEVAMYPLKERLGISGINFDQYSIESSLEFLNTFLLYAGIGSFVFFIISLSYFALFWMYGGQTIGKKIMGIKVVKENGEGLQFSGVLLRYMGYIVSNIFFLGFLWIVFDRKKQGWHDKIAGTFVIKV